MRRSIAAYGAKPEKFRALRVAEPPHAIRILAAHASRILLVARESLMTQANEPILLPRIRRGLLVGEDDSGLGPPTALSLWWATEI
jgi:hypothetical protein